MRPDARAAGFSGRGSLLSNPRGVAVLVGGTGIAQLGLLLAAPVLTRLYTPSDLGLYGAAGAIVAVTFTVGSLRYEQAIPLPAADRDAAALVLLCGFLGLTTGLILGAAMVILAAPITRLLGEPRLADWTWLIVLMHLGASLYQVMGTWAVRVKAFSEIARTRIGQTVVLAVSQVGLGVVMRNPVGLLAGDALGRSVGAGRLTSQFINWNSAVGARPRYRDLRDMAVRYRRFPLLSSWSALLNAMGGQLPLVYLLAVHGTAAAGLLVLAQRVVSLPNNLLGSSVAQVYLAEAAVHARGDRRRLGPLFLGTVVELLTIGVPIALGLCLVGLLAFPVIFGDAWAQAGTFLALLTPMYSLGLVGGAVGGTLDVLERQDLHLAREASRITLLCVAIGVAWLVRLDAVGSVALIGAAGAGGYIIYISMSWYALAGIKTE